MSSIVWYDYETSGTDPRRDRVLQFAAIRTSEDLAEIEQPVSFYCRPADDCLPAPDACLVTGITPQLALREGINEADAMARIHALFSTPQTCVAGYNNLRFDDEFTRFGLYRNYFDAYEREWRNGNSRWDLLDVLRAACLLRPEGIDWPLDEESGFPSFRLEALSVANGIEHSDAHDALADVRATIAMARKLKQAQPRFYQWAYRMRRKAEVQAFLEQQRGKPLLHVSARFPAEYGKASLVWPVARHPRNSNSLIVFDLRADPAPLYELPADEIARRVFTRQDELADGESRLPLKEVHLNRCPALLHAAAVDDAVASRMRIDVAQCRRHADFLRDADSLQQKLGPVFERSFEPEADPDVRLYDGFIGDGDRGLMAGLRAAPPAERRLDYWPFSDERLRALMLRYRARNWPELLSDEERGEWQAYRRAKLGDVESPRGIAACLRRIDSLRAERSDERSRQVLDALEAYARSLLAAV